MLLFLGFSFIYSIPLILREVSCLFTLLLTGYIGQEDDYISGVKLYMYIFLEEDLTMLPDFPYRANQGSTSFFYSHLFLLLHPLNEHWGQCST